jgi:hypothetical protein
MESESPKDKLLKACGVPSVPGLDQVSRKHLEAILKQAETASSWAQQAQDETDKNYRRLNAYIRDELPAQLVKAFEQVESNRVAGSLRPLDNSVSNAAARIKSCAEDLAGIPWDCRLLMHTALMGMFTVLITGGLVRCTFFGDKIDEAKRYEVYGRKVVANIERYSPKDQEKIYKCIGGRP